MNKDFTHKADFTQLEQRTMEHFAKEHGIAKALPLLDIHTITTAVMLTIPYSAVTSGQRRRVGKNMNFAALYTPGVMWEVPSEAALMAIWSEKEKDQLYTVLGIGKGEHDLYEALVNHFNKSYGGKA